MNKKIIKKCPCGFVIFYPADYWSAIVMELERKATRVKEFECQCGQVYFKRLPDPIEIKNDSKN